nr:CPBP family intramembrane metalloprotease [Candidatus Omnitrophota bacterium]
MNNFLRRERLYILLLIFIVLVNVLVMTPVSGKNKSRNLDKAHTSQETVSASPVKAEDLSARRQQMEEALKNNKPIATVFNLATLLIMAVLCLGLLLDILLLMMRSEKMPLEISTYMHSGPVSWNMWDVAKVVILFFFFGYVLIIAESFLVFAFPYMKDNNFRMILNSSILDVLAVVFILHFAVGERRERLVSLGISFKNFAKNIFYGIAGYLAAIPALVAVVMLTAIVVTALRYNPPQQAVVQLFMKEESPRFLAYASFFAAVAGPIIEELFFRGFMYNALKKIVPLFWAMGISSAAFAALHAHAVGFLPILVIGMLLAYLYEKTGTLVASVTVHILHN